MFIWTANERMALEKAIKRHGVLHQSMKLAEELGELQQALMKNLEYVEDSGQAFDVNENAALLDHLAEEIADALIMIEQQVMIQGLARDVAAWKDIKMDRLRAGV